MHFLKALSRTIALTGVIAACGGGVVTPTPRASLAGAPTALPLPSVALPSIPPIPGATSGPAGAAICDLLTSAELSTATGKEYGPASVSPFGECYWNLEGVSSNTGSLVVGAIQPQDLNLIKASFGSGGVDTTVAGHAAFWNPAQGLNSLWVDIGNGQLFVLSFPRSGDLDPSYKAIAESLATIAVSRM